MDVIFTFAFFFFIFLFIIGVTAPHLFAFPFGKVPSREKIAVTFCLLSIVFFILFILFSLKKTFIKNNDTRASLGVKLRVDKFGLYLNNSINKELSQCGITLISDSGQTIYKYHANGFSLIPRVTVIAPWNYFLNSHASKFDFNSKKFTKGNINCKIGRQDIQQEFTF